MRFLIAVLAAFFLETGWMFADQNPDIRTNSVALGASTGKTNTINNVRGFIHEVSVCSSDGISTGNVSLAYIPRDGISAAVNISTGVVANTKLWRPAIDSTDVNGADLTSDPPGRIMLAGESVRLIVTSSSKTNISWHAIIKLDRVK